MSTAGSEVMSMALTGSLRALVHNTFAYLMPSGSWGLSNCGLVCGSDGTALLVDTQFTLGLTQTLLDTIAAGLPDTRIDTVAVTHANGDHAWGVQLLPDVEIISSAQTAHGIHGEIPPDAMASMLADSDPASPLGRYMRIFFGAFDWSGIVVTAPTTTFTGRLSIEVGTRAVELIEVGPAHTAGDVIVHVPDAGVVYTGDIMFENDHPVMWSGPITGWIAACDRILATGAGIIVPGHGPLTDRAGVARLRGYLEHVADWAQRQFAAGVAYDIAAATIPLEGFQHWGHPERLVITIGRIYEALGQPVPGGRLTLIRQMAERYASLTS